MVYSFDFISVLAPILNDAPPIFPPGVDGVAGFDLVKIMHTVLTEAHKGKEDCDVRLSEDVGTCQWINHHCETSADRQWCQFLAPPLEKTHVPRTENPQPNTRAARPSSSPHTSHSPPPPTEEPNSNSIQQSSGPEDPSSRRTGRFATRCIDAITQFFWRLGSQTRRPPSSAQVDVEMAVDQRSPLASPSRVGATQIVEDTPVDPAVEVGVVESARLSPLEAADDAEDVNAGVDPASEEDLDIPTTRTEEHERSPLPTLRGSEGVSNHNEPDIRDDLHCAAKVPSGRSAAYQDPVDSTRLDTDRCVASEVPGVVDAQDTEEVDKVDEGEVMGSGDSEEGRGTAGEESKTSDDEDSGHISESREEEGSEGRGVDATDQRLELAARVNRRRTYSCQSLDYEDLPSDADRAPLAAPESGLLEAHSDIQAKEPDYCLGAEAIEQDLAARAPRQDGFAEDPSTPDGMTGSETRENMV